MGGAAGVGVKFLDQKFSATTAPPPNRKHKKAAQEVLKALLPEAGTDIKGHMRTREQLAQASGYERRPNDFEELLNILENHLKLVKPVDWESARQDAGADEPGRAPGAWDYQLTHDFLIPSLRAWLTGEERKTYRGRAELCLADRTREWFPLKRSRYLPSLWEWVRIALFARRALRTGPERALVRAANRYHLMRVGILFLAVLGTAVVLGWRRYEQEKGVAEMLANEAESEWVSRSLMAFETIKVRGQLRFFPFVLKDRLKRTANDSEEESARVKACIALSLLGFTLDDAEHNILYGWLLAVNEPDDIMTANEVLKELTPRPGDSVELVKWLENRSSPPPAANPSDAEKDTHAREKANAAAILARCGKPERAWQLLGPGGDAHARTYLVRRFTELGVPFLLLKDKFRDEGLDTSTRRSLILSLGGYPNEVRQDNDMVEQLSKLYKENLDPGIHAAAEWSLRTCIDARRHGIETIDVRLATAGQVKGRGWYVTETGRHTFVEIRDESFKGRYPFAIATKEVTLEQYVQTGWADSHYDGWKEITGGKDSCPIGRRSWHQAARYCNWLSEKEGLKEKEWYYHVDSEKPLKLRAQTSRNGPPPTGYRLPTEEEWVFACRAGEGTWYEGSNKAVLSEYAWYLDNAKGILHPVGMKKPNAFGLFDMLGNVREWCGDELPDELPDPQRQSPLRGGSFFHAMKPFEKAPPRDSQIRTEAPENVGFRVARYLPPSP
jgi:hypothetical protein